MKRLDLTGKRFGSILVVGFSHLNKRKSSYWNCKCDCGEEIKIRGFALNTGITTKCFKCSRVKKLVDHTGKKFGRLTALRFSRREKGKETYWIFRCDCGTEKELGLFSVTSGVVKSCGCYKIERCKELAISKFKNIRPEFEASKHQLYTNTKLSSSERGLSFDLTEEEFIALTSKNCHYCNQPPSNIHNPSKELNGHYVYNGLDRVNNLKGYSIENCVPCCTICNNIKHTHSPEIFLDKAEKISTTDHTFSFKEEETFEGLLDSEKVSAFTVLYNNYKRVAERRQQGSFQLSKTEFLNFLNKTCYYCGHPPSQYITLYRHRKNGGRSIRCQYAYTGIDRINNEVEYTIDKCVPCCKYCNDMKRVLPQQVFLRQMEKIYLYTLEKNSRTT